MAVNPADELAQSFGPQQDFGPQDSGPAVTTKQNISTDTSGSRFEPEIGRLREIQTQLPGAIQKAAAAEGEALKSKSEAETAGAEKLDKAAQARTDATRGAYDAYGEKITKQPLPAFVPTEENAETLGALFSGVNLLGLIMSRGAGRSSALGAMKSMTGMLEGYKSGRKDLYEREKQVFEKNYARIKDIHAQYAKDLDKAVKLAEVDFEGGKIAAQLAAKKAGNSYAEKAASAGNLKAVVTGFNEEAKLIKQITDLQDREMNRESREAIAASRAAAAANRPQSLPSDIAKDLKNASETQIAFDRLFATADEKFFQVLTGPRLLVDGFMAAVKAGVAPKVIMEKYKVTDETVRWWMAYENFIADVRKERFGATLTGNEKQSFERTIIQSNTNRELAIEYLREQQKIINDAARRTAGRAAARGVPDNVIQSYFKQ